MAEKDGKQKDT